MSRKIYWIIWFRPIAILGVPFVAVMVLLGAAMFVSLVISGLPKIIKEQATPRPSHGCPVKTDFKGEILRVNADFSLDVRSPAGEVRVYLYGLGVAKKKTAQAILRMRKLGARLTGQSANFCLKGWDADGRLYVDGRLPDGRLICSQAFWTGGLEGKNVKIKELPKRRAARFDQTERY